MKLTIELIPSTAHYTNVRSNVVSRVWNRIRKKCYKLADNRCEICGDIGTNQGRKHKVECHEIWKYDLSTSIQKLTGFIALCPLCHQVKHFGRTQLLGVFYEERAIRHLSKINNISRSEVLDHILQEFNRFQERSKIEWHTDIAYIHEYLKGGE